MLPPGVDPSTLGVTEPGGDELIDLDATHETETRLTGTHSRSTGARVVVGTPSVADRGTNDLLLLRHLVKLKEKWTADHRRL